jgi:hypothetical protein
MFAELVACGHCMVLRGHCKVHCFVGEVVFLHHAVVASLAL